MKPKTKRQNFTLSDEATQLISKVDKGAKSYIVSQAIINFLKGGSETAKRFERKEFT